MPVPTSITDLSTTASSNYPGGTDSVAANTGPDDYFRAHAAIIRTLAAADTIAAASTVDLSTKNNTFITLTGTATTINALGTVAAGVYKWLIYKAAHTVTHNATSLILMGGATRTVAAGDASLFVSEGSGNWRELFYSGGAYQPLDATLTALAGLDASTGLVEQTGADAFTKRALSTVALTAGAAFTGLVSFADGLVIDNGVADGAGIDFYSAGASTYHIDNFAGTLRFLNPDAPGGIAATLSSVGNLTVAGSVTAENTPAITGSAPVYACRAWVNFNGTGTVAIRASGNVSSITDNGVGDYTINFTTALPDADYSVASSAGNADSSSTSAPLGIAVPVNASSCRLGSWQSQSVGFRTDFAVCQLAVFR